MAIRIEISFVNGSERLRGVQPRWQRGGTWRPSWSCPTAEHAAQVITEGLKHAQAARITIWPARGEWRTGRTDRKRWHGNLHEVFPTFDDRGHDVG